MNPSVINCAIKRIYEAYNVEEMIKMKKHWRIDNLLVNRKMISKGILQL